MDITNLDAVNTTVAPVTESAPVEESTVDNSVESSEKTEITSGDIQDGTQGDIAPNGVPAAFYERFKEVNEKAKKAEEYERELQELRVKQQEAERLANMTPDEVAQQQQLEVAKETLKKLGFVTKEEQQKILQEEKAANMFISECNRLEDEYNGNNGLPKFVATEIAAYMDELAAKGQFISDPETAYKLRNMDSIIDAKAKAQRSSTFSEKQQGGMNQVNDTRGSDLDAASKTGNITQFLKKYAPMPKS